MVQARLVARDARVDLRGALRAGLGHELRVRQERAGQAHEVRVPAFDHRFPDLRGVDPVDRGHG